MYSGGISEFQAVSGSVAPLYGISCTSIGISEFQAVSGSFKSLYLGDSSSAFASSGVTNNNTVVWYGVMLCHGGVR